MRTFLAFTACYHRFEPSAWTGEATLFLYNGTACRHRYLRHYHTLPNHVHGPQDRVPSRYCPGISTLICETGNELCTTSEALIVQFILHLCALLGSACKFQMAVYQYLPKRLGVPLCRVRWLPTCQTTTETTTKTPTVDCAVVFSGSLSACVLFQTRVRYIQFL